jgi:hypothetical protein
VGAITTLGYGDIQLNRTDRFTICENWKDENNILVDQIEKYW